MADHCRLTNTAIIDYSPADDQTKTEYVDIYGSYNEIDPCYFEGKTNLGPTVLIWVDAGQPNYAHLDYNYFAARPDMGFNGGESIRIGDGAASGNPSDTLVESNYFEHCDGDAEIISSKSGGNVFRANTFFESTGTLSLRQGNNTTVEGNFFFGDNVPDTGGVRVTGDDQRVFNNYFQGLAGTGFRSAVSLLEGAPSAPPGYARVRRAQVVFNTFVGNQENLAIGVPSAGSTLPPLDCRIANNAVLGFPDVTGPTLIQVDNQPINMVYQGNLVFGADPGVDDPGVQVIDPQLSVADDGLYPPSPGSPVIAAAQGSWPDVTLDMNGQPRPADDASKDVGADQVSDEPPTRFPLGPGDIGPSWWVPPGPRRRAMPTGRGASVLDVVAGSSGPGITFVVARQEGRQSVAGVPGAAPASAADLAVLPVAWPGDEVDCPAVRPHARPSHTIEIVDPLFSDEL